MSIESRSAQYNTVFGDWRIEKQLGIGSGGKSAVFSMYRDNDNWREYCALKVISLLEEQGSREDLTEFQAGEYSLAVQMQRQQAEQEVLFMDQLRGKTNIVDYLDHRFCQWQDEAGFGLDLLIRMEKLTDLRSQIRKGCCYSVSQIVRIGQDVCRALQICHKKNILHRDIKPENIFFNEDGDYKLGDFGVSKIVSNVLAAVAATSIGTAAYSAPEQFSGAYDRRVDIYSLGLVLYELSNGNRLPFAGSRYITQEAIQTRLTGTPLPVPQLLDPNRGGTGEKEAALWHVIQKACAFRPDDRYPSAAEMLQALNDLQEDTLYDAGTGDVPPVSDTYSTMPTEVLPVSRFYSGMATEALPVSDAYRTPPASESYSAPPVSEPYSAPPAYVPPVKADPVIASEDSENPDAEGVKIYLKKYIWLLPVLLVAIVAAAFLLRGEKKPPEHTHDWSAATCQQPAQCSICGETQGEPLEHAWVFLSCETPRHCADCGFNEETAPGHAWLPATADEPAICEKCGETQGASAVEELMASAAELARNGQYLAAIRQMQEAWAVYGQREFYDAAAKYRTQFSVYNMSVVAAGKKNTALLNASGDVTLVGDNFSGELEADGWIGMRAVGLGDRHVVGLTKSGMVVALGSNQDSQYSGVHRWQDVVDIAVGDFHTVALLGDGTVVSSAGYNHAGQTEVEKLMQAAGGKRIVAVSAGYDHTLALLEDGTVVGCGDEQSSENDYNGSCAVESWTDIAAIYSGTEFSAGLRLDGTVVVAGVDWDMSDWTDIVNLAAGDYFLLGLKSNGTVVYKAIRNSDTQEDFLDGCLLVAQWRDIVHIAAGSDHSVAVAADGTVYCIGANDKKQCALDGHSRNG